LISDERQRDSLYRQSLTSRPCDHGFGTDSSAADSHRLLSTIDDSITPLPSEQRQRVVGATGDSYLTGSAAPDAVQIFWNRLPLLTSSA
jgi:hypothetical protein